MRYQNPVLRGFSPDPSICRADGMYYLVCSSFQYFPGVPLFESPDLVNWTQIGYALNRESRLNLEGAASSSGIFAPTIRYHEGQFYMVTTNACTWKNFYVYTDDIHGPWSDPIAVDQGGIDPSLLFDGPHTYFLSNGAAGTAGRELSSERSTSAPVAASQRAGRSGRAPAAATWRRPTCIPSRAGTIFWRRRAARSTAIW